MNKIDRYIPYVTLVIVVIMLFGGSKSLALGGTTNYDALDVTDGYYVDGTQIIDGSGNFVGALTPSSIVNSGALTQSGASTFSATTTVTGAFKPDAIKAGVKTLTGSTTGTVVTAADICDYGVLNWPATIATSSLTFPTAGTLQADCLDVEGSYTDVEIRNTGVATSTIMFTMGASSTLQVASSTTATSSMKGQTSAIFRFVSETLVSGTNMVEAKLLFGGGL